jgi:hypothetical protein
MRRSGTFGRGWPGGGVAGAFAAGRRGRREHGATWDDGIADVAEIADFVMEQAAWVVEHLRESIQAFGETARAGRGWRAPDDWSDES